MASINDLTLARKLTDRVAEACAGLESGSAAILDQVSPTTAELLKWWFQEDFKDTRSFNFHDGQRAGILNVIYAHEVLGMTTLKGLYQEIAPEVLIASDQATQIIGAGKNDYPKYCLKMATGTGKTWVLQALMVWQILNANRTPENGRYTKNFLIVAPGLIVYDRLRDAFEGKERDGKRDFSTSDLALFQELFIPPTYRDEVFRFVQGAVCPKDEIGRKVTAGGLVALTNWHVLSEEGEDDADDDIAAPGDPLDPAAVVQNLLPLSPGTSQGNDLNVLNRRFERGGILAYLREFRSFGTGKQSFELPTTVAVLWGGNSQGKTSLAESIEFLLTGQIARRELLASTKEEFSDSLRNAHIPDTTPVTVSAEVICPDGKVRCLKRTLNDDYKKGSLGCTSTIEIDGQSCQENDIQSQLGIKLFPSPLSAPVLAQHTLGYIFSAGPNERAAYFRAILDTQDLEDFRAAVAAISAQIVAPSLKEIGLLQTVEAMPELGKAAAAIRKSKSQTDVEKNLLASTTAFLTNLKITPQSQLAAQAAQIEQELQNRRAKSFPLDLFARSAFIAWDRNSTVLSQSAQTFLTERAKIDTETRRLVELFKAALSLPEASDEHDSADCPLCGTVDALTSARVQAIREQVKATDTYQTAEKAIKQALQALDASLSTLSTTMDGSLPKFMREKPRIRRGKGFTLARIRALVNDEIVVKNWMTQTRHMARIAASFSKAIASARTYISSMEAGLDSWNDAQTLILVLDKLSAAQSAYEHSNHVYGQAAQALATPLRMAVDESTKTIGWEELVKLARDPAGLWNALVQMAAHEQKIKSLEKAIKEIDAGNGKVADEKFTYMSAAVKQWWDYLRPDEPTFFDAVQRRSNKTRRTIDIKVGLSVSDDRSNPKFRDAIAVFSQSQLHCLGLSMFLARAVQEKTGFIIMDDPVLTSDDDFRPNFASTVIEGLMNEGLQVIILTQDHSSWKDIGHRWSHRDVAQFQIVRNDPLLGTEIRNQNDGLATMIAKAQPFIKSHDLEQRKEGAIKTRLAIERFGKEILVKNRRQQGDSMASITNYDGQNFGDFSNSVYALLTQDPAHPGKLRAAHSYVTPGPHDDTPPSSGQLSTALGDLKKLKRDYLD